MVEIHSLNKDKTLKTNSDSVQPSNESIGAKITPILFTPDSSLMHLGLMHGEPTDCVFRHSTKSVIL